MKILTLKDGRKVAYETYGVKNGKVFFYLHGWPASRLSGDTIDMAAKKLNITVISPDRPGYGQSTYSENRKLIDYADDISQIANILSINKFSIIGVSGGGPYAVSCAYKIPEKLDNVIVSSGLGPLHQIAKSKSAPFVYKIIFRTFFIWKITTYIWIHLYKYLSKSFPTVLIKISLIGKPDYDKKILLDPLVGEKFIKKTNEAFRQGVEGAWKDFNIYFSDWGFSLMDVKKKVILYHAQGDKNAPVWMGRFYKNNLPNRKYFEVSKEKGHYLLQKYASEILQQLPIS
jgi:pimeloyl-ACP methyl ester carboxylesterase